MDEICTSPVGELRENKEVDVSSMSAATDSTRHQALSTSYHHRLTLGGCLLYVADLSGETRARVRQFGQTAEAVDSDGKHP